MQAPFIFAISGLSTSGKTLMVDLLSDILTPSTKCYMIHQDDFYKSDSQIPMHSNGLQDWDCADAIDFKKLAALLFEVRNGQGLTKLRLSSSQPASAQKSPSNLGLIAKYRHMLRDGSLACAPYIQKHGIVLVEGFLLFGRSVEDKLSRIFDKRIVLRTTFEEGKTRRAMREGYVTSDGFWKDPPDYFEKIVWPNYVQEHAHLFIDDDVLGEGRGGINIDVCPLEFANSPEQTLKWLLGYVTQKATEE